MSSRPNLQLGSRLRPNHEFGLKLSLSPDPEIKLESRVRLKLGSRQKLKLEAGVQT